MREDRINATISHDRKAVKKAVEGAVGEEVDADDEAIELVRVMTDEMSKSSMWSSAPIIVEFLVLS